VFAYSVRWLASGITVAEAKVAINSSSPFSGKKKAFDKWQKNIFHPMHQDIIRNLLAFQVQMITSLSDTYGTSLLANK
jgi:hypothetical protein